MCEEVGLEGIGDGDLQFLDALVSAVAAAAVHLRKGCDRELGFNGGVSVVPLASTGDPSQIGVNSKVQSCGGGINSMLAHTLLVDRSQCREPLYFP